MALGNEYVSQSCYLLKGGGKKHVKSFDGKGAQMDKIWFLLSGAHFITAAVGNLQNRDHEAHGFPDHWQLTAMGERASFCQ